MTTCLEAEVLGVSDQSELLLSVEQVDKVTHWGDLESEEEEESSEEDEAEEDQAEVDTESLADGLSSVVSGYSSLPSGLETPEAMDLRKGKAGGRAPHFPLLSLCLLLIAAPVVHS